MANRFPLILDTADSNKLKELPNGDNLDLTGSGISAVGDIQSTGTTTAKAVKLSGYTTAERDALGAVEGQMIYNSSTDTFQGYMGSSWQSFSSGFATSDLNVITSTPTGGGALSYNSSSGTFTFSPAATAAQNLSLSPHGGMPFPSFKGKNLGATGAIKAKHDAQMIAQKIGN